MVELREQLGVSMSTLHGALQELKQQQILRSVHGVGIFVKEIMPAPVTGTIGLILHSYTLDSPASNFPYMQALLHGIREECRNQNIDTLLINASNTSNSQKVDGCLLYCDKLEALALDIPRDLPRVLLIQRDEDYVTVTPDNFSAGKIAINELIRHGHRRIACLMEISGDISNQRVDGYRVASKEAEIIIEPEWMRLTTRTNFSVTGSYLEWGQNNMRQWLAEDWHQLGCTAIMVQNDHAAIGVMQVLQEAGINVPEQVGVIGFDGTSICDLVSPQLSSVQIPYRLIGREAVKVLCEQIQTRSHTPREISLPVSLRKGGSVMSV